MKLSKRTNTIILWLISIGLLVSMLIAFTPTINGLFGSGAVTANEGATVLNVNGNPITELELARAQQNVPFYGGLEGEAADDVNLLIADNLIFNEVLAEAADKQQVSNTEVRDAVNEWRAQQGVGGSRNDSAYINLIGRLGYDDSSFRAAFRESLKQTKYRESLTDGVEVSDEEVRAFYDSNTQLYQAEPRIVAREIVVDDAELAADLLARAQDGEDFATLARENSTERADRDGAIGAPEGSTDPQAVGRAALPTAVANAAFGLGGPGLTEVVEAAGKYYIVSVEDLTAAETRPFEEVAEDVRTAALEAKQAGVLEETLENLRSSADITTPDSSILNYSDETVATVGEQAIKNSELVRVVYNDPQISQSITASTAQIITDLFKPTYLERLIESELAYQGAATLDANFVGTRAQVAQQALSYVSKDATATPEEYQTYYDENQARFTVPASALQIRVNFDTQAAASAFRAALLDGTELVEAAETNGGTVVDLGTVSPGDLPAELDTALFATDAFEALPDSENSVSDVLVLTETVTVEPAEVIDETPSPADDSSETPAEVTSDETASDDTDSTDAASLDTANVDTASDATTDQTSDAEPSETSSDDTASTEAAADDTATQEPVTETVETFVVLVGTRTEERVRPFDEVQGQVEAAVLGTKRSELQTAWLDGLRETIPVDNILAAQNEAENAAFETTPLEGEDVQLTDTTNETTSEEGAAETGDASSEGGSTNEAADDSNAEPADENSTDSN